MRQLYYILLFIFIFILQLPAQPPSRFLLYSVKDGLSQNSVHAIFRDRDGLVWIGTQDGLNSFDGKTFTVYRHIDEDSTSISDQFILNIGEDGLGNVWIGTRNGLNCFNKHTQKFKRYYLDPTEQHNFQSSYRDFFVQEDNNIAVLRNGIHIIAPQTGNVTEVSSPAAKACNWFITPAYSVWAIDADNILFYTPDIRKKKMIAWGISPFSSKEDYLNCRAVSSGDSLLFVYNEDRRNELAVFNAKSYSFLQKITLPPHFIDLSVTNPNNIIATYPDGIFFTGITRDHFFVRSGNTPRNGLPPGAILTTYTDREGNLWAGTSGNGLAVSNESFNNYDLLKPPVTGDVITGIAKNDDGLFIGTRSGLFYSSGKTVGTGSAGFIPLLKGQNITALATDAQKHIWAGVQGKGIWVLDKKGIIIKKILPGSTQRAVIMNIANNGSGMLISTTAGFFSAGSLSDSLINFSVSDSVHTLRGNYVMSSFSDRDGNVWIANNNGLDVYNRNLQKKLFFNSTDDKSSFIKRTIITSVTQDSSGVIWIGTIRNGIYKYDHGNFSHYTVSSGLASDVVYNVICDSRDRLWASTSAGLTIFNKLRNAFVTLTSADGVPTAAYIFGAAFRDKDDLYFGTSEGLLICHTNKINVREAGIRAFVADVKVNGQSVILDNADFNIMADDKLISFDLAVSPAFFSGNIIYQYRIEGLQNDWTTLPPGIHSISYTGLPYKKLYLQVRAAGSVDNLNSAPVNTITIKSKAPFWKTGAFITVIILILIALVIFAIAEYHRKNYKKQLQQLQIEKGLQGERVRIGRDLHDNIGAYTSALISGLDHIRPVNAQQEKQVTDLKEYGSSIMGFLRETIWMLNAQTLTVTDFTDRFKNYILRISNNYPGIDFRFEDAITEDKTLSPSVMLHLFRILQEALQNACKHSGATVINFSVKSDVLLCFEIKDNGSGFDGLLKTDHYGLHNMKQRAAEAGFLLTIETNNGTLVRVAENTANAALRGTEQ